MKRALIFPILPRLLEQVRIACRQNHQCLETVVNLPLPGITRTNGHTIHIQVHALARPIWVLEDGFTRDGADIDWATEGDQFEIMAQLIPPRSKALGAQPGLAGGQGEIDAIEDMGELTPFGFSNEAYDHSAQFLNSYVERNFYWNTLKTALTR